MSEFVVRVEARGWPPDVWRRLWDLDRHTAVIPLTTVVIDPPATALAEGVGFTGRTVVGPVGFDDPMRVTSWQPPADGRPGRAIVDKVGGVVGGRIEVTLTPFAGGTLVVWRQEVVLPWLPRRLRWLEAPASRLVAPGYRWALRRLLA